MIVKDMALTRDDLLRLLPGAVDGLPWRADADRIQIGESEGDGVDLLVEPLPPRRFGPVEIPRLRVGFAFRGWDEAERCAFLARFDRAFQRGGG
ncbi:hypothetical protein [Azospirillum rugosum]|uniref:Uncharacterized protein n=1 Tax=Azospirillum rugosum TaxID=416170 RepID=A0ABS4SRR7_9PROT|nr:hypothetical protein [Azospirillum rugosum]MBP2295137.1 hypothetical protein [Azospirillum rugosum]MDQ0528511.1 hypothetical protein [Azospirillum rugosum]